MEIMKNDDLLHKIKKLCNIKNPIFHDGMESQFSRELTFHIENYGNNAISKLEDLIIGDKIDPEIAAEALRWIGRNTDKSTHDKRLQLLGNSLTCSSPLVREGALLGLAALDDSAAIPFIEKAISIEPFFELQHDMSVVAEQLKT